MHDYRKKKHHITTLLRSTKELQKERGREVLHVVQSFKGTVEDQFDWDKSEVLVLLLLVITITSYEPWRAPNILFSVRENRNLHHLRLTTSTDLVLFSSQHNFSTEQKVNKYNNTHAFQNTIQPFLLFILVFCQ